MNKQNRFGKCATYAIASSAKKGTPSGEHHVKHARLILIKHLHVNQRTLHALSLPLVFLLNYGPSSEFRYHFWISRYHCIIVTIPAMERAGPVRYSSAVNEKLHDCLELLIHRTESRFFETLLIGVLDSWCNLKVASI